RPLDPAERVGLGAGLARPLTPDRQRAVLHRDFDVLWVDAGQVRAQHVAVLILTAVDGRAPIGGECAVKLMMQLGRETVRLMTHGASIGVWCLDGTKMGARRRISRRPNTPKSE